MQKIEIPYFDNTLKDVSARLIPDTVLQNSKNIFFYDKKVRTRHGIQRFSNSLDSEVVRVDVLKQLYSDMAYVIGFTAKDMFYWDYTVGSWKYITRCFNKGTVSVSGSTVTHNPPTATTENIHVENDAAICFTITVADGTDIYEGMRVTDAATSFSTDTFVSGVNLVDSDYVIHLSKPTTKIPASGTAISFAWDFQPTRYGKSSTYEIAFGTDDPNLVPAGGWYVVNTISSNTQLSTTTSPGTKTAVKFCLRLCYYGDIDNVWSTCFPYDDSISNGGDKCMLATNGIDYVQRWKGVQSGVLQMCQDLYAYPNKCKHLGFYGSAGGERVICANTENIVSSTTYYNKTGLELSDAAELYWEDGVVYALYDSSSEIIGTVNLQTQLVIYKRNTISLAQVQYGTDYTNPLSIQQDFKRGIGAVNINTVINAGFFHLFFDGSNIIKFDGYNHAAVDDGVALYIGRLLNKKYLNRCFAFHLEDVSLYCLVVPTGTSSKCNYVVVYNYEQNNFTFWDFRDSNGDTLLMSCAGQYILNSSPTWDSKIIDGISGTLATTGIMTTSSTTGLVAGMRCIPAGFTEHNLYIKQIINATTFYVGTQASPEVSSDPNMITTLTGHTIGTAAALRCGFTALQLGEVRWSDLKAEDTSSRILLGDPDGNIWELNKLLAGDNNLTNVQDLDVVFESKDFEFNKGLTFLSMEVTLRLARLEMDATLFHSGSVDIRCSVDYGRSWSTWVTLALDGTEEEFMEKKVALHMRGKALRFQIRNTPGYNAFVLENCFIGFNVNGQSFKYDR